jgi:hypothetical protein
VIRDSRACAPFIARAAAAVNLGGLTATTAAWSRSIRLPWLMLTFTRALSRARPHGETPTDMEGPAVAQLWDVSFPTIPLHAVQ